MTSLDETVERFYELNVGLVGTGSSQHERPHKPVLLLVILDLLDEGRATPDLIAWDVTLRERFSCYFDVVKAVDDRDSPENPFRYLVGDGFWQVFHRTPAGPVAHSGEIRIRDSDSLFGRFIDGVDRIVAIPTNRAILRQALVSRYFPKQAARILGLPGRLELAPLAETAEVLDISVGRTAGFRRKVTEAYDHQCAACGLRIRLPDQETAFVDAAHLMPFSVSNNDHPTNGIALCKNHHWAMDRNLIAPAPSGLWQVTKLLIPRRSTGEIELAKLAGQPVLPPNDDAFRPDLEAMRWRVEHLIA